jgi:hypothetical protein
MGKYSAFHVPRHHIPIAVDKCAGWLVQLSQYSFKACSARQVIALVTVATASAEDGAGTHLGRIRIAAHLQQDRKGTYTDGCN